MDFGSLLRTAKENEQSKKDVRVYSTKFAPPKKEEKKAKTLSANIQKFLARKEAEEKKKQLQANQKRDELLALRSKDKKATRRVNVMLKRTKSANQSVIADAVDKDNTSVTLAGPSQPDEDDYGYVSQEAAAYYNQMMEKYNKMPDDPKFPSAKKRASNNLTSTKDRVKAALEKEREEALLPHKRKRKHVSEEVESEKQNENNDQEPVVVKAKPKVAPPPSMNFDDLLKLAAVKQHEPIMIEVKPKEEEGPLLTKKQKKELEREQLRKNQKILQQSTNNKIPPSNPVQAPQETKIRKVSDNNILPQRPSAKNNSQGLKPKNTVPHPRLQPSPPPPLPASKSSGAKLTKTNGLIKKMPEIQNGKPLPKPLPNKLKPPVEKVQQKPTILKTDLQRKDPKINSVSQVPHNQMQRPTTQNKSFPPKDLKLKQFPPPDVRNRPPQPSKQKLMKRRIIDDDEYDSEMDDFIDDGPEEMQDYSKYIKDIFGYDKSKYRGMDDDDVDNMESTFAQQMKEDVRSTKLGIMEDLEDIKREREEKKRKAIMMKKRNL
ncbi:hypothetical protein FQR65_LT17031 [Abscondita terminalis]|nr:hypothetical protein FQR65_LT17031 [Abscondita terminalis]